MITVIVWGLSVVKKIGTNIKKQSVGVLLVCMSVYLIVMSGASGGQKRAPGSLERKLQMERQCVGVANHNEVLTAANALDC